MNNSTERSSPNFDGSHAGAPRRPLIPQHILQNWQAGRTHGNFGAAALFVDISGFTPLTAAMMAHGIEGAEVLAQVLDDIFEPLIAAVYRHGGFIAGFAGDAFKALFAETLPHAADHALAAAEEIRRSLADHPLRATRFGDFLFAGKACLAVGDVEWEIWSASSSSSPETSSDAQRAAYVYRGAAIADAMALDPITAQGQIVATPTFVRSLQQTRVQTDDLCGAQHILQCIAGALSMPPAEAQTPAAPLEAAAFYPQSLLEATTEGEFRRVTTIFVAFESLPPSALGRQQLAAQFFSGLEYHEGFLCRVGQIGSQAQSATLLLTWGAPRTTERDVHRALSFLDALRAEAPMRLRAGVTTSMVYAGFVGAAQAQEYTCYGSKVNQAARQMIAADWGEIWLDEESARQADGFRLRALPAQLFKGFDAAQTIHLLEGRAVASFQNGYGSAFVGRHTEMETVQRALAPLTAGRFAGVFTLIGEPGIGKSRLVFELLDKRLPSQVRHYRLPTDQILRRPLNPFRYWLRGWFEQENQADESARKARFEERLSALISATEDAALATELERTRSFLGALVDLHWEESLYARLSPQLRQENTLDALKTLVKAICRLQPLILHIEDVHWLDDATLQLLPRLVSNVDAYPFLVLATARPDYATTTAYLDAIASVRPAGRIVLTTLSAEDVTSIAVTGLGGPIAPDLATLLTQRSDGNPFFAEQILLYLREQGLLALDEAGWHCVEDVGAAGSAHAAILSGDARAILTARLDRLPLALKKVVLTASVLGREFETRVLAHMVGVPEPIDARLEEGVRASVWLRVDESRCLFRHALLRDAAYDMQLRSDLRTQHQRAGAAIEAVWAQQLPPHAADLAYHYDRAEHVAGALSWYAQAAEYAEEQYANDDAVGHYNRALQLVPADPELRFDLLSGREAALGWLGRRHDQAADIDDLATLSNQMDDLRRAAVCLRQTAFALTTGRFDDAFTAARQSVAYAEQAGDALAEARALHRLGRAHWESGDAAAAQSPLSAALQIAEQCSDLALAAQCLYDLGIVASYRNLPDRSIEYLQQATKIFEADGDLQGKSRCLSIFAYVWDSQGHHEKAMHHLRAAIELTRKIGWRYGEARFLNNLGDNLLLLGCYEEAGHHLTEALAISMEIDDDKGGASTLDMLGLSAFYQGDLDAAKSYFSRALRLHQEQGNLRGEGFVLAHLGHLSIQSRAWADAEAALVRSQQIRQKGDRALLAETELMLAQLHYQRDNVPTALRLLAEVTPLLLAKEFDGMEYPLQAYAGCAELLLAMDRHAPAKRPTARHLVAIGCRLMQERAALITDPDLHTHYLTQVPFHVTLLKFQKHLSGDN